MSTQLHLAGPEEAAPLEKLVAAFHAEQGIALDPERRRAAIAPLLEENPYGAVYLAGPKRAPVGYILLTFGWSIEFGGLCATIDELFVRDTVRGRGIGTEMVLALGRAMKGAGVLSLHLEVDRDDAAAQRLYGRAGFEPRDRYLTMARAL